MYHAHIFQFSQHNFTFTIILSCFLSRSFSHHGKLGPCTMNFMLGFLSWRWIFPKTPFLLFSYPHPNALPLITIVQPQTQKNLWELPPIISSASPLSKYFKTHSIANSYSFNLLSTIKLFLPKKWSQTPQRIYFCNCIFYIEF